VERFPTDRIFQTMGHLQLWNTAVDSTDSWLYFGSG